MSRSVSPALRTAVEERASACCEYCRVPDLRAFFPHEPDHIIAGQHGGEAALENLARSCMQCNRAKGTNLASVDPLTGQPVFLFHPRREAWSEHFQLEEARIAGLTPAGRATARLLNFNDPERVEFRAILLQAGRYPLIS